jgi:hypothetical protein
LLSTKAWPTGTCIQLLLQRIQNEENIVPKETMQAEKKVRASCELGEAKSRDKGDSGADAPRGGEWRECGSCRFCDYLSLEPYALALARGDSDFRLAVDRALSQIYRSGEIATVF